jgi:hypothetical protein
MTVKELSNCLPTPLAMTLVGYDETDPVDWPRHFKICELATIYLENILRAQLQSDVGLERPQSWGTRLQRIQSFLKQLAVAKCPPVLDLGPKGEAEKALRAWISLRNRWAHSVSHSGRPGGTLPGRHELVDMLTNVLLPLCAGNLVLGEPDMSSQLRVWALRGIRGLFDPPQITLFDDLAVVLQPSSLTFRPNTVSPFRYDDSDQVLGTSLFFYRETYPLLPLEPYLCYRQGLHGENRVEFLSEVAEGVPTYLDPLHPVGL